jgi:hypothetical protein
MNARSDDSRVKGKEPLLKKKKRQTVKSGALLLV